jgi:hypothetical protein
MHTHLYAQTGHFATPKEMVAAVVVVIVLFVGTSIRKAARA